MSFDLRPRLKLPSRPVMPSPHRERSHASTVSWVRGLELTDAPTLAELERADPALYGACVLPDEPPEVVDLCAHYFAWLILFDDAIGECHTPDDLARLRAAMDVLAQADASAPGAPASAARFARAVRDLGRRGAAARDAGWSRAFEHSVLDYVEGCLREAPVRLAGRVPSFSEYQALRRRTIGALPILDIVELSLAAPLPRTGLDQARIRDVRERAAYLFAWANDLLTYKVCRTEKDEEDRLNLVTVLAAESGAGVEAAFAEAARVYAWELERLEADLDPWLSGPSAAVTTQYARAVLAAVYGNVAWYERSLRYRR